MPRSGTGKGISKMRNTKIKKIKTEREMTSRRGERRRIRNERKEEEIRKPNTIYYHAISKLITLTKASSHET
jgi:hypothetical protein